MEVELKLLIDPADKEKLEKHPLIERHAAATPQHKELTAVYFDTPDLQLRRHDAGLRLRKGDGKWMQTMKAGGSVQGGLHQRHEWECPVDGRNLDLEKLKQQVGQDSSWAALLATPGLADRLEPLFTVRVMRTIWNLFIDDNRIELVLDQGSIEHGDRKIPVSEIELELKSGNPESLYDFALRLLDDVPLRLSNASKAERGYALRAQSGNRVVKAQPLALKRRFSVEQGLQAILGNCLAQIRGNEDGVIEGNSSESLHQMRVGLRRLRSALRLFEGVAPCPAELQQEIEWLGAELGAARDWDVLSTSTLGRVAGAPAGNTQLMGLQSAVLEVVQARRREAAQAVASPRYSRLLLGLFAWIQAARWRDGLEESGVRKLDAPLKKFARSAIKETHRRVVRRGRDLEQADAHALHRLRIAGKKSRYAVEFFQSLYPARRARPYVATLARMQDELGWRNDVSVGDGLLQQFQKDGSTAAPAASFARGYLAAQLKTDERALRRIWKKFRRLKMPFKA